MNLCARENQRKNGKMYNNNGTYILDFVYSLYYWLGLEISIEY